MLDLAALSFCRQVVKIRQKHKETLFTMWSPPAFAHYSASCLPKKQTPKIHDWV
jgi:hypothetical protein